MLSLAMVIGFGGMTRSIYTALTDWLDTSLNPDFFITPTANLTARTVTFPSSVGDAIAAVPGVDQVQLVRNARVLYRGTPVMVISVEAQKVATTVFRQPLQGDSVEMHRLTAEGKGLIVSDGFESNLGVRLGDMVELPTPSGLLRLPVAGIVRDYSDMLGSVFIDRAVYTKWWNDDTANIARVYVRKGEDARAVRERVISAISGTKRLLALSNDEVRAYVLRLTDQWFAVTYNQILVAILVAVLGIVNTLTVSITDRRRELGVMQAVGGLRRQVRRAVWLEALAIGAIGLTLGIALGAINVYYTLGMVRRDLGGLDLDYVFPVTVALSMIPVILAAAFLAALGPAESAVRGPLVNALEYE
jgi:putative ABC transport system permease protein